MEQSEVVGMTLVTLPLEVVEVIAGYLNIEDLTACCSCSHSMRDLFSDDNIWRPRCDKELCEYLKVTPFKVEPHFTPPKFEHSSLSPIPQWKMAFMYQNHLWNNWRFGRKVMEVIQSQESASSGMMDDSLFHLFLTSDCILALYPDRLELLDVRDFPASKAASDIKFPKNVLGKSLKVMAGDGMVIISYHTLVEVFQIDFSTKESVMTNVFFIEDTQKVTDVTGVQDLEPLIESTRQNHARIRQIGLVGNFLIAICMEGSKMHIWDVRSGVKVKTQDCPIKQASILNFKGSGVMNLILCVAERKSDFHIFLAYNLASLTFFPFRETFKRCNFSTFDMERCCDFSTFDRYVAVWTNNLLTIFNYVTSKPLLRNQPIQSQCYELRNNFVFLQDNILKIFLPSTKVVKNLLLITVPKSKLVIDKVRWIEVLGNKFIQVKKGFSFFMFEVDEALDLKHSSLRLRFESCNFFLNKTLNRYIVRSVSGQVIHFW